MAGVFKGYLSGHVLLCLLLLLSGQPIASFHIASSSSKSFLITKNHQNVLRSTSSLPIVTTPRGGALPPSSSSRLHMSSVNVQQGNNNNSNNNNNNNNDDDDEETQQLNWARIQKQAKLFGQMSLPYYKESTKARWLLAGVLALTLANSGISVLFSYVGKDFWNALSAKDTEEFYTVLSKYVGALVVGAPVVTLYKFQREQLAVHWREWMTVRTFDLYSTNQVYYKLERLQIEKSSSSDEESGEGMNGDNSTMIFETIDNPDQRIAEDVKTFTSFSLSLLITILTSLIDLASFSTILWSIYPQLFGAVIVYAFFGTFVTAFLGKSLVGLNFRQLRREADLRYLLVRMRDNAESIAFYAGEDLEGQAVEKRVERVMDNKRGINAAQRNLEFFTNAYRYLVQILPVAVVAPRYFAGEIALGVISQSAGAFNHILSDLSILINQFEQLSAFSAGIERLSDFYEAMRTVDTKRPADTPLLQPYNATALNGAAPTSASANMTTTTTSAAAIESTGSVKVNGEYFGQILLHQFDPLGLDVPSTNNLALMIEKLDLCTPDQKRVLIRGLSMKLKQGENLLIVGNSGAGKSSLLRAIAGLWTVGNGRIDRPADQDVYFLPQRPYCTIGSLKDQLLYPSVEYNADGKENGTSSSIMNGKTPDQGNKIIPKSHLMKKTLKDQDFLDILEQVDLYHIAVRSGDGDPVRGLYSVQDWSNQLSLGEQQRLAFGRLLVNRPSLVILDEATSALDIANEARMYTILKNMAQRELRGKAGLSAPGLTYISVGHRPSLVAFHDKRLRLAGEESSHEFADIEKSTQIPSQFSNL